MGSSAREQARRDLLRCSPGDLIPLVPTSRPREGGDFLVKPDEQQSRFLASTDALQKTCRRLMWFRNDNLPAFIGPVFSLPPHTPLLRVSKVFPLTLSERQPADKARITIPRPARLMEPEQPAYRTEP